jgi:hypothetical protein
LATPASCSASVRLRSSRIRNHWAYCRFSPLGVDPRCEPPLVINRPHQTSDGLVIATTFLEHDIESVSTGVGSEDVGRRARIRNSTGAFHSKPQRPILLLAAQSNFSMRWDAGSLSERPPPVARCDRPAPYLVGQGRAALRSALEPTRTAGNLCKHKLRHLPSRDLRVHANR